MKVLILLVVTGVLAHPAPQHKLSGKAYVGLSQALGGRIPVGIYSANRIFHAYENHDNDVVLLNLPGLSGAVPAVGGGLAGDLGALGGGVGGFAGKKGEALGSLVGGGLSHTAGALGPAVGGIAEEKGEALGSLVGGGLSHTAGALGAAVGGSTGNIGAALGEAIGSGLSHGANALDGAFGGSAFDTGDALGAAVGSGLSHGLGALGASFGGTGALAEQLGEGAGAALGSLSATLFRSKRQDSEQTNANQLSFALSGLGTLFGANLGRWLDSTFDANVKLINGMENVGTIVLDQVDDVLVRVGDQNRTKADGISLF